MRIGIEALDSLLGGGGGVDVYTRLLLEALVEHAGSNQYVVLANEDVASSWAYRSWPPNVEIVSIRALEPRQPVWTRGLRHLRRRLGVPPPAHYGDPYVARQIDALGLDLIHYPGNIITPLETETPCALTLFDIQHEYYPDYFTRSELEWRAPRYHPSVDKARRVIVPSGYTRRTLREKYLTPEAKIAVIPVGIADNFQRAGAGKLAQARTRNGLPEEFIYYPANPWPHKNHARLMAALRLYRDRYGKKPALVLSGRLHNEKRDARELAIAAGIEDQVIDLGFLPRDDCPMLYSSATLLVFPSLFEGFGIPLLEAMRCGCPIAAADATSIPEVVGDAALLFDPLDPEAICDAIHRLLTNPALRTDLVQKGQQQLERFRWDNIVPLLMQVYEQVANERV